MKQAKVLSESELKRVLSVIANQRHAARNLHCGHAQLLRRDARR